MTEIHEAPPFDATTEATLLAESIVAALVNSRIYALTHPRVIASIERIRDTVKGLADGTDKEAIRLGLFDGMLVFQRRPLLGASISVARLNEHLTKLGAGGIEIDKGADIADLTAFFALLVDLNRPEVDYSSLNTRLSKEHCVSVRLLPPYADGIERGHGQPVKLGLTFYQSVIDLLQSVTVSVCRGGHIDFGPVQAQAEQVLKRLRARDDLQLGLARQDQYDAFTFGHSLRVAILSMHFAQALTDDDDLIVRVGTAALLHDVGKSLIPFEILHSTKMLSEEERHEMNKHAQLGGKCLLDHHESDPLAIAAAFGHHRTPDGGGYPVTSHKHPVSMVTSIVKICDIFEALTAARPYKMPMSPIRAYRVMIAMRDKLDQKLLRRFIEVNGIYPVGQLVELDGGDVAVVRAQSTDMQRPHVAILAGQNGTDLLERDEELLDLSDMECDCVRRILLELTPDQASERMKAGQCDQSMSFAPVAAASSDLNTKATPVEPDEPFNPIFG